MRSSQKHRRMRRDQDIGAGLNNNSNNNNNNQGSREMVQSISACYRIMRTLVCNLSDYVKNWATECWGGRHRWIPRAQWLASIGELVIPLLL